VCYNKNHGTSALRKHACHEYPNLCKKCGLLLLQRVVETQSAKQGTKKRKIVPPFQITNFFGSQQPYHKLYLLHQTFLEDLVLYVTKGYCLSFLLKICGYSVWFCDSVGVYNFPPIAKW
jgi:hypothetical protein